MPNIAGYEDNGDGTSVLIFDDGQVSQPVILTDKDKSDIDSVASMWNSGRQIPEQIERQGTTTVDRRGTTVIDNTSRDSGLSPEEQAIDDMPGTDSVAYDDSLESAQPKSQLSVQDPMSEGPSVSPEPKATTSLPVAQEQTENPLGDDAPGVRQKLLDAAFYDEQARAAKVVAEEKAAVQKGKLIADRLSQMEVERKADEIEAAQRKKAIDVATKLYEREAQKQLDPKQAFGSEPAWFKVLTLIGLAAGAAYSGKNHTLEAVNQTIDQSLKLQQERKDSEISRLTKVLGSEQAALDTVKARMQKAVEKRLELGILQADNEAEAEWLRTGVAAIRSKRLETEAKALASTATSVRNTTAAPRPVGVAPSAKWNAETREEKAILDEYGTDERKMAKYTDERVKQGGDAIIGLADQSLDTIQKLTNGQDVPGSGPLDSLLSSVTRQEDAAAVKQTTEFLKAAFLKAQSGAAVTDSERELYGKIIEGRGTLSDWKRGIALLKSKAVNEIETLNAGYSSEAGAYDKIKDLRRGRKVQAVKGQRAAEAAAKEQANSPEAKQRRIEAGQAKRQGSHEAPAPSDEEEEDPFRVNSVPKWK